jgi:hypothetical protein
MLKVKLNCLCFSGSGWQQGKHYPPEKSDDKESPENSQLLKRLSHPGNKINSRG